MVNLFILEHMKEQTCPYCDKILESNDVEEHLKNSHFLGMQVFYEMGNLSTDPCWRCGKARPPLSYVIPGDFKLPCWDCLGKNKYEKPQATETMRSALLDFYTRIKDDRFLQMFLIDPMFFDNTLPHTYDEFKKVLKLLQKSYSIDRNRIWFPDFNEGYPRIISQSNIRGLKIVSVEDHFKVESGKTEIRVNDYVIKLPEFIPFDQRHHSRYNIFNLGESRNTKRLRLKKQKGTKRECLRLYNTSNNEIKSLFQIEYASSPGSLVPLSCISPLDLTVLKLVFLRNKTFYRLFLEIMEEFLENIDFLSDSILLRNSVLIDPLKNKTGLYLTWTGDTKKENYINISIL